MNNNDNAITDNFESVEKIYENDDFYSPIKNIQASLQKGIDELSNAKPNYAEMVDILNFAYHGVAEISHVKKLTQEYMELAELKAAEYNAEVESKEVENE